MRREPDYSSSKNDPFSIVLSLIFSVAKAPQISTIIDLESSAPVKSGNLQPLVAEADFSFIYRAWIQLVCVHKLAMILLNILA